MAKRKHKKTDTPIERPGGRAEWLGDSDDVVNVLGVWGKGGFLLSGAALNGRLANFGATRDAAPPDGPARHSPDFREVNWFGRRYWFSAPQAAIVALLWAAWESGCPEVGHETLLHGAELDNKRLRDIFRGQLAWGRMIVEGRTKGAVKLRPP